MCDVCDCKFVLNMWQEFLATEVVWCMKISETLVMCSLHGFWLSLFHFMAARGLAQIFASAWLTKARVSIRKFSTNESNTGQLGHTPEWRMAILQFEIDSSSQRSEGHMFGNVKKRVAWLSGKDLLLRKTADVLKNASIFWCSLNIDVGGGHQDACTLFHSQPDQL